MRVHYHTFGCKANQYDTERMRQEAEARGLATAPGREGADIVVINTCTVTNQADADARRLIRRVRREHPDACVVVAGCSAALREADYRAMPGVRDVVPGHDAAVVAGSLERFAAQTLGQPGPLPAERVGDPGLAQLELRTSLDRIDSEPIGGELLRRRAGAARGWLKVQDGCDRKCSFCATRLARGASRSRPVSEVVAEARLLARTHAELVVTGIHIGHYGRDLEDATTLSRLCAELLDRVPEARFRLGSIEATEVDDLLVELLEGSDGRLAPHLHMPLQSGADPVLRLMRRWHTREEYRRRALDIAARVSPLGLGADVITGFPGERAADHAATRDLVAELPFTYLHVFPYSPRDGTVATTLSDPVPQRLSGERARELRELALAKGQAYRRGRCGQRATVVVEGDGGTGVTEDYLRVAIGASGSGSGASGKVGSSGGFERTRLPGASEAAAVAGRLVRGTLLGDADHLYIDPPEDLPRIPS
jgi:threonylcarbamoyladenosine tRNA methylthiotransferase MtaB